MTILDWVNSINFTGITPERDRAMLLLRLKDISYREIGARFGVSKQRVEQILRRGVADYAVVPARRPDEMERAVRPADERRVAHELVLADLRHEKRTVSVERRPLQSVV